MAAALILLISIVVAVSPYLLDDVSQHPLQRFIAERISETSGEFLLSISSDLLVDPSCGWSPNVFRVKNVYESGRRNLSWHLNRVLQLLVLLCGDIERNPGPNYKPSYVDRERSTPLLTSSTSVDSSEPLFPAPGFTVLHLNIRSLYQSLHDLREVVQQCKPDVMALSET